MVKFLTVLCLFLAASLGPGPATAQTIKLGTLAPEGSVWYNVLRDMAEDWKEISNGRIQVRIYQVEAAIAQVGSPSQSIGSMNQSILFNRPYSGE